MKIVFISIFLLSMVFSVVAKPGESYALTGRETSIFGIFQAEMKAHWELYKGEDVNACYEKFRAVNNLDGGRKLKRGETLLFPHTQKSKAIEDAELEKVARAEEEALAAAERERKKAEAAAAKEREKEAVAEPDEDTEDADDADDADEDLSSLFGSDTRAGADPQEQERKARRKAVSEFHQTFLLRWVFDQNLSDLENGAIESLITNACEKVDEPFADALVLHRYPEKKIYILELEKPEKVGDYFFLAIKSEAAGKPEYYALEKGISFFGVGELGKLSRWSSAWSASDLGGREYCDLAGFLSELEAGRPKKSDID